MTTAQVDRQHAELIAGVRDQFQSVLDGSSQGVYIYLDDRHKVCNQAFAAMLGYESPEAWDRPGAFTEQYVAPQSRETLVSAYRGAMEHMVASVIDVTWRTLDGKLVPSTVILVPVAYADSLLALHFVTRIS